MAEAERFELSVGYEPTPVFKTGAFNRSAKLPWVRIIAKFLNNASLFCNFLNIFKIMGEILKKYFWFTSGCTDLF